MGAVVAKERPVPVCRAGVTGEIRRRGRLDFHAPALADTREQKATASVRTGSKAAGPASLSHLRTSNRPRNTADHRADLIAEVTSQPVQWVVPRGTVP